MPAQVKAIVNFENGEPLCERAALADGPLLRLRGLLGRSVLPAGDGLLLRPSPGIHTAFMRFPIDALFLDRDLHVLDVVEHLRPWRAAYRRRARAVLELAAGEVARRRVEVGDRLAVIDGDSLETSDDLGAEGHRSGRGEPLRILLISHDHRFRTVASLLLTRRGCTVTTSPEARRVAELVERERTHVVVIDAGSLLTAAARTVAVVEALTPPVGVVVVGDEEETGLHNLPVLAKWGPFDEFFATIERARSHPRREARIVA